MVLLPCRHCGSMTVTNGGILNADPILCPHCKQPERSGAAAAVAKPPRKPKKRGSLAPAETYLNNHPGA